MVCDNHRDGADATEHATNESNCVIAHARKPPITSGAALGDGAVQSGTRSRRGVRVTNHSQLDLLVHRDHRPAGGVMLVTFHEKASRAGSFAASRPSGA